MTDEPMTGGRHQQHQHMGNSVGVHSASLKQMVAGTWRRRQLVWQMVRRDVIGRYKGSIMGLAWSFLNPLLMLAIYTFVFSVVFKARWGMGEAENQVNFAIVLFVGLIAHGLFSECVNKAPMLIVGNANYVKKVVFPLEVLSLVTLGSALFHAVVSLFMLFLVMLLVGYSLHWTVVLVPLLIAPLCLMSLGFSWLLASLGVFLRDVGQITTIFTTMLLFLSPVFYPITAIPEQYRGIMKVNPLTVVIEHLRMVIVQGQVPDAASFVVYLLLSVLVAWLGFWWFQKTRNGFADVM